MESALSLTVGEAKIYANILKAVSKLPNSDPRLALVIGVTWWLVHRRRRLEQQRIRRRQFYRRWRRLLLLRQKIRNTTKTHLSLFPSPPSNEAENTTDEGSLTDS